MKGQDECFIASEEFCFYSTHNNSIVYCIWIGKFWLTHLESVYIQKIVHILPFHPKLALQKSCACDKVSNTNKKSISKCALASIGFAPCKTYCRLLCQNVLKSWIYCKGDSNALAPVLVLQLHGKPCDCVSILVYTVYYSFTTVHAHPHHIAAKDKQDWLWIMGKITQLDQNFSKYTYDNSMYTVRTSQSNKIASWTNNTVKIFPYRVSLLQYRDSIV